jgi:NADPH-dependent curcumin reductase CurA
MLSTTQVHFESVPEGWVKPTDMSVKTVNMDDTLEDGSVLLKTDFLSVDPYMRGNAGVLRFQYNHKKTTKI